MSEDPYLVPRILLNPSARKSIHNNSANTLDMGRYGLAHNVQRGRPKMDRRLSEGHDEIDNVMSKINRSMSPMNSINRKSPHSIRNLDGSNIMSKSLPATLPSQSYSSFTYTEEAANTSSGSLHRGNEINTEDSDSDWDSRDEIETPVCQERRPSVISPKIQTKKPGDLNVSIIAALVVAVFGLLVFVSQNLKNKPDTEDTENIYGEETFDKDLNNLGKAFHINDDAIMKVKSGITTISKREDAGSFIFVYNSQNPDYSEIKFNDFIKNVANLSAKYLRNNTAQISYVVVERHDLTMATHGDLMRKYRDVVEKHGLMVVKQLEDMPYNLAMAFHYYCDEYDPLVKKSAIFFTLDLGKCATGTRANHQVVEKCLTNRWNTLPIDILGPLLTRIVNVIVDIAKYATMCESLVANFTYPPKRFV